MKNGRHIAEFYGVGVMLAIVGGYLDAYTYISRDHVFANAQTGNMVLLAINIKRKLAEGLSLSYAYTVLYAWRADSGSCEAEIQ